VTTLERLRDRLDADGFAVIPDFKSPGEIAALRARAAEIVAAFDPRVEGGVFSASGEEDRADAYFLTSGPVVRCFFEAEAFAADGALRVPKALSINKIGHAMHDLDPVFRQFSHGPELAALGRAAGLADPRVYQSMYIFKQPHIGGEVRWHQDATYFWTEPQTVLTLWFALERADRTNGCLWVQRCGHRGPLRERFVVAGGVGKIRALDAMPWPAGDAAEPVEVDAGTLVVFHGLLPHYSAPNRSATSRHAYTLHAVDGAAQYATENWLQRDATFPARGFE